MNEIRYKKQHCPGRDSEKTRVVIRFDHYGHHWSSFMELVAIAKADFPTLADNQIEVIHYGGDRISGYWGIEFDRFTKDIPADYEELSVLELMR